MNHKREILHIWHAYSTNEDLSNDTKVNDLVTLKLKIAFWTLLSQGGRVFHKHILIFFNINIIYVTALVDQGHITLMSCIFVVNFYLQTAFKPWEMLGALMFHTETHLFYLFYIANTKIQWDMHLSFLLHGCLKYFNDHRKLKHNIVPDVEYGLLWIFVMELQLCHVHVIPIN